MEIRLGVVTIGQAPRGDLIPELALLLPQVEFVERGVLDGASAEQLVSFAPRDGDHALTTRLVDGSSVVIGERWVMERLPGLLGQLAAETDAVLLACTGSFPSIAVEVPFFVPDRIITHTLAAVAPAGQPVGIVAPLAAQCSDTRHKFARVLGTETPIAVAVSSPYTDDEAGLRSAVAELASAGARTIALDCFGYTVAMRDIAADETGLPIITARSAAARVVAEALGIGTHPTTNQHRSRAAYT